MKSASDDDTEKSTTNRATDLDDDSKKKKGWLGWIEEKIAKLVRPVTHGIGTNLANLTRSAENKKPVLKMSDPYEHKEGKFLGKSKNKMMSTVALAVGFALCFTPAAPFGGMLMAGALTKMAIDYQGKGKDLLAKGKSRKKYGAIGAVVGAILSVTPLAPIGIPMFFTGLYAMHQGTVEIAKAEAMASKTQPQPSPSPSPQPPKRSSNPLSPDIPPRKRDDVKVRTL